MLLRDEFFRVEIDARDRAVVVLNLFGELDLVTMPRFEVALEALIAVKPRHAIFDISGAEFIDGDGYEAIGRCTLTMAHVTVCPRSGFAQKILDLLGFDSVAFAMTTQEALCQGITTEVAQRISIKGRAS